MIAAYIRVSTKDQNPDLQREEISSWAKSNGIEKVTWYEDRISGDKSSRPRLDALRKDIFAGKIKTVILWKLDRLARSKRDGETLLADWCSRNVRVVSITQQIDLSGVVGQIVASVKSSCRTSGNAKRPESRSRRKRAFIRAGSLEQPKGNPRELASYDPKASSSKRLLLPWVFLPAP